jgi:hypothetical protein
VRETVLAGYRRLEHRFDAAFGSAHNPLRQLGATAFLLFWLLAISGIYLYIVLDTSAAGAYPSINHLSREQWYFGGVLRSLHRYGADAFVVVVVAHLVREWLHGRYNGFRRFSWLTGVPLLVFVFVSAIGGFWLNWDQLGQFSAVATAEWLDWLPFFASPMTRNFLNVAAVSDRLFSLFVFVHLGVALLLVFGLWFHIQRISRAAVFPSRRLAWSTLLVLLVLALVWPVMSGAPADLARVPDVLALDWLLLFIHPLTYAGSGGRGRPGQLQRLPALLRRLPLRRGDDGASPQPARRAPDGAGEHRPVRELRHLRRRLSIVDAFPKCRRAGDRHRHAQRAHRRIAPPAAAGTCIVERPAQNRCVRVQPRRAGRLARRARRGHLQPDVHRRVAALVRRIRIARRRVRGAGERLPRRRLRVPARPALDRTAPGRGARAAPARLGAAWAVGHRLGRCGRRTGPAFGVEPAANPFAGRCRGGAAHGRRSSWLKPGPPPRRPPGSARGCSTPCSH